jgi:hypothetical protein
LPIGSSRRNGSGRQQDEERRRRKDGEAKLAEQQRIRALAEAEVARRLDAEAEKAV